MRLAENRSAGPMLMAGDTGWFGGRFAPEVHLHNVVPAIDAIGTLLANGAAD